MLGLTKEIVLGLRGIGSAALSVFICALVSLGVYSCSSGSPKLPPTPEVGETDPALPDNSTPQPGGFGLAGPVTLMENHSVKNLPDGWTRDGFEFEQLLPNNRVIATSSTGIYLPSYIPGTDANLDGLAYALYVFSPGEVTGGTTIHFNWELAPVDFSQFFVGVGQFQQNKWDWFQPGSASQVFLDSFEPYRRVEVDGAMVVVVALTGGYPVRLKRIWLGAQIAADTIYAVPEKTLVEAGEVVRVNVYVRETALPMGAVTVRLLVTEGNQLVQNSFNIGATGGAADELDGVWASSGISEVLSASTDAGSGSPAGLTPLDFTIAPFGENDIEQATGGLFNFQLKVNRGTELVILRKSAGTGPYRTYYSNHVDYVEHYWANDTNEALPQIRVVGFPVAVLELDLSEGDTPLLVQFDASESYDEQSGVISKYEYDFGEGDGYEDYGSSPLASHVYNHHGAVAALLRVTNSTGLTDYTTVSINPKRYDEIEDNDSIEEANTLPPFPVLGFRGNIGYGGDGELYDNDREDYFTLDMDPGVHYRFYIEADDPDSMAVRLVLLNQSGTSAWPVERERWIGDFRYFEHVGQAELAPYSLRVKGWRDALDYSLNVMRWPPMAVLEAETYSGDLPFLLELDAGKSWDAEENDIVGYEFDFGDGEDFIDNGTDPTATHTYTQEGLYFPMVKVLDAEGNFDFERVVVYAGRTFDELEPNSQSIPQPIELPLEDYRGSCGHKEDEEGGVIYQGYDGSWQDCFSFNAIAGETVFVTLVLGEHTCDLLLSLFNDNNTEPIFRWTEGNVAQFEYTILPEDAGEMTIRVSNWFQNEYAEYSLNAVVLNP